MEYISKSEKETFDVAAKVASLARVGDIFALYGDLGSGKTTFAKGFAKALGIKKTITSPTFVIQKEYPVSGKLFKKLVHIDCYRLGGAEDAESIGLSEYFNNAETVLLLEWPDKIESILPANTRKIFFEYVDENTRKIITGW